MEHPATRPIQLRCVLRTVKSHIPRFPDFFGMNLALTCASFPMLFCRLPVVSISKVQLVENKEFKDMI